MSSISFVSELGRYAASRLATARIAALTLLVIFVSLAISAHRAPVVIATTALLATLLIVQFRLWDDLDDIDFDRLHHPHRILVISRDLRPYFMLVAGLALLNATMIVILRSPAQLGVYLLLLTGGAALYRRRAWPGAWRLARTQLVLVKYPAFLYLCAHNATFMYLVWGGITTYLLLGLVDLLSDNTLRHLPARRRLLSIEIAAFTLVLATFIWSMRN